ncbi:MAG: DsbA family protein [Arcobacteraceae bacterium]
MGILYYILDPMCSWCYAFSKTWETLLEDLPSDVKVIYVYGGLAPHSSVDMPLEMQEMLQHTWKQIDKEVGTKFNYDFWTNCKPRRSTYLSCQAAISGRLQGKEYEMVKAIQEQYYLNASNPSNRDILEKAANNIGLDMEKFSKDLESEEVIALFDKDLNLRDKMKTYSFPSLVFKYKNNYFPIKIQYNNPQAIVEDIIDLNSNIYF